MANLNLSMFWICGFIILSLLLFNLKKGDALGGGDSIESQYLTVQTSSLLPSSVCNPSTKGPHKRASSLKLVHRHGPCSRGKANALTISQILSQDQSRVSLIQSRIALASKTTNAQTDSKVNLPVRLGNLFGTGNYIVNIGLGTPEKALSLFFDTGSDLTWTQCKPCPSPDCHPQKENMFDPSGSSSYSGITCRSSKCNQPSQATDVHIYCGIYMTCMYNVDYKDKSFSKGFLGTETLTLTPTDVFNDFTFGCGNHQNSSLFGETAGLLSLGRGELSFVSQTATKYGKYFSYCLPSKSSSVGHLTFGKVGVSSSVKFTPFSNSYGTSLYVINVTAIYVGGTKLPISTTTNSISGSTVIDSGTVITRLPRATYNMLRDTFRQMMKYPSAMAEADDRSLFDTCYNLSNYSSISLPKISFLFNGNVMVDLHQSGIFIIEDSLSNKYCLAFASTDDDYAILGNVQQKTLEVVYDVAGGKLGFGAGGCA